MGKNQNIKVMPTEAGHYYHRDGRPCYTMPTKSKTAKNPTRPTTIKDCRELSLAPSVTTITRLQANLGLQRWIENQILLSASTINYSRDNEDWIDKVREDAKQQSEKAKERGTLIHGDIEKSFNGLEVCTENLKKADKVEELLYVDYGIEITDIEPEKSFAGKVRHENVGLGSLPTELWFGGKMDLKADNFIADIKTTEFTLNDSNETIKNGKKAKLFYDDHLIQLCGYALGCGLESSETIIKSPTLINIYVSTIDDSVWVKKWSNEEVTKGTEIFKTLLKLWYLKNG